MPQIEVTFDIDANSILTVTARDRNTGKEQQITISGSTQLPKEEIDRMVRDAEAHSQEDRRRREEIEARNQADAAAYQVERMLNDLGNRAPLHEKARAEQLIAEVRDLVKQESSNVERLRQLTNDLMQISCGLTSAAGSPETGGSESGQEAGVGGRGGGGAGDDVIDAEFRPGG